MCPKGGQHIGLLNQEAGFESLWEHKCFDIFYIGLWCNGNTEVSEAFVRGSNPCRPTMSYGVMVTHGSLKPTLWVRVPLGLPICGCSVNGLSVPGFQPGGKSSSLFIRTTYGSVAQ